MPRQKQKPRASSSSSAIDISGLSVTQLDALIESAGKARSLKMEDAKTALIEETRQKAKLLGLSIEDLIGTKRARAASGPSVSGGTVPPKYKFPSGAQWTGRGRLPREAAELKAKHGSLDNYLIKK